MKKEDCEHRIIFLDWKCEEYDKYKCALCGIWLKYLTVTKTIF